MSDNALWRLGAVDLAQRFRDGSLTPMAVAQACLARLEAVNPQLNAVIARRDEQFLAEAVAATERHARGMALSPLDGIPLTVKDSLLTSDLPTTWGSPGLRDYQSQHDELSVGRARAAGALIIGKTNVPEFALEGYTDNPLFGPTRNPWNLALTPGGSSGGAVAAVASGIAPLAIGQDGGGSIRRPASHTGLVGLKPSLSAVPREHVLPSLLLDFEVIGPLARTVADARQLFEVMRGPALVDRSSLAAAQAAGRARKAGPARVLYVERFGNAPLDPQIASSVSLAVARLQALGHRVECGALPLNLEFFVRGSPAMGSPGVAEIPRHGRHGPGPAGLQVVADPGAGDAVAARDSGTVRWSRRDRAAVGCSAALAGRTGIPQPDRRSGGRAARPCDLYGLGQRFRPAGTRPAMRAVA